MIQLSSLPYCIIVCQCCFFLIYQLSRQKGKERKSSHYLMMWFIACLGLNFLNLLLVEEKILDVPNMGLAFALLYSPILYLYTRSVVESNFSFKIRMLETFIPSLALFLWILLFDRTRPSTPAIEIMTLIGIVFIQFLYFFNQIRKKVKLYDDILKERFSSLQRYTLQWVKKIILFTFLAFVLSFARTIAQFLAYQLFDQVFLCITTIAVIWLLFSFLDKVQAPPLAEEKAGLQEEKENNKYSYSKISDEQNAEIFNRLNDFLHTNKDYLIEDLSVDSIAEKLMVPAREVSRAINTHFGSHFYNYINSMRIQEAIRLIQQHDDLRVSEIMYKVGYSSRSSFNSSFKKITGLTPTEFRRKGSAST